MHRSVKPPTPAARSVVLGAALGASLGIPFGLMQVGAWGMQLEVAVVIAIPSAGHGARHPAPVQCRKQTHAAWPAAGIAFYAKQRQAATRVAQTSITVMRAMGRWM